MRGYLIGRWFQAKFNPMESRPHGVSRTEEIEEEVDGMALAEGSANRQSGTSESQSPAQVQPQAHAVGQPEDDRNRTALMAFFVFAASGLVYAVSPVIINFDSFPGAPDGDQHRKSTHAVTERLPQHSAYCQQLRGWAFLGKTAH